ncbi:MAG: ABC transporter permease [Aggregatilineales bacterium]
MADDLLIRQLAGIVSNGAPLVLAAVGETLTERSGVINLGLDGALTLAAFTGFLTVLTVQGSLSSNASLSAGVVTVVATLAGVLAAMLVGVAEALLVAFSSIELKRSQVAVGFVLTLLCRDLAIFLGGSYRDRGGISVLYMPIPVLKDIPILGPIFFQHDPFTYLSLISVVVAWFWIFRTKPGLMLRSVGERPATAFARGANVNRVRYAYAALGGALIGLGGAAYTLNVNLTWNESSISGNGWIALAMVIFGGWQPIRVMFGIYLVAALRAVVTSLQSSVSSEVIELINALPWLLMIGTLFLVSGPYLERLLKVLPPRLHPVIRALLRAKPPAALGTNFE